MELKDIIKSRRLAINKTLEEIGKEVGVSKATVLRWESGEIKNMRRDKLVALAKALNTSPSYLMGIKMTEAPNAVPYAPATRIPILGRIAAGYPLYAEEHIEGYTYIDTPEDGEYFGLVVSGDSMDAARIQDGDLLIVRRQSCVDNGDIAVVLVNGCDATVKRFYKHDNMVTLVPQSSNPRHVPQMYDLDKTELQIQGKVVEVKIRV